MKKNETRLDAPILIACVEIKSTASGVLLPFGDVKLAIFDISSE